MKISAENRSLRRHRNEIDPGEIRDRFQQDRDRVLYSSAFRRLAGITQVAAVREHHLLHTRLTHSLKVGQIGRRIVEHLIQSHPEQANELQINADVVEAASLAHDLGHPPFGHIAEGVLNKILSGEVRDRSDENEDGKRFPDVGGFEGNAQSFRAITKLERRYVRFAGLDLTAATLNATLKYPWFRGDEPKGMKWGAFPTERDDFEFARSSGPYDERTPEAMIVDWADDISYALHDVEDFYRAGLVPLHELGGRAGRAFLTHASSRLTSHEWFDSERFAEAFGRIVDELERGGLVADYSGKSQDKAALHDFVSGKITECLSGIDLLTGPPYVKINEDVRYDIALLKELTWHFVIERPGLAVVHEGEKRIIRGLFEMLIDWLRKKERRTIPRELDELFTVTNEDTEVMSLSWDDDQRRAKATVDYVCTLTERQATDLYERLTGLSSGSIFGSWFA